MFFLLWQSFLLEEELAHVEQVSAVATEVTSSMMRLKLEVEEKKRAISLLQTALVCQPTCGSWGCEAHDQDYPLILQSDGIVWVGGDLKNHLVRIWTELPSPLSRGTGCSCCHGWEM